MIRKRLYIYIIAVVIAIIGLLWGQYIWIRHSYDLKNKELTTKVLSVLNDAITQTEDSYYCIDFFSNSIFTEGEKLILYKETSQGLLDTLAINFWNPGLTGDSVYSYKGITMSYPSRIETIMHVRYMLDSLSFLIDTNSVEKGGINSFRFDMRGDDNFIPIFDSIFRERLVDDGINVEYEYFINIQSMDSIVYFYPSNANSYDYDTDIKSTIFSQSYFFKPYDIRIAFPSKDSYIFGNLLLVIGGTLAFIIVLVIFIGFFIKTIVHQKRLAEMKSDFIHNMTHEFKTPLSNVNLALDTLERKNGDRSNEPEDKLMKIIREENMRLQDNVNLILNTAFFEEKAIQMNKEELDINEIIIRTAALFDSEIMDRKAEIEYVLDSSIPSVLIDETHFTNVVFNLIDNAIKYSKETARIIIKTYMLDNNICLSIEDRGIGIPSKSLKHIFDKFYRVPSGKVHDVKGFGLGLTYVKYIVDAHKAIITIESKAGSGSTFTITIPKDR